MTSEGSTGSGGDKERESRPDGEQADKVIRLPRDWLGPRDELIPFGPSREDADASSGASPGPAAEGEAPRIGPDAPDDEAVSAEDFWGERSAAVQGPLDESDQGLAEDERDDGAGVGFARGRRVRVPALAAAAALALAAAVVVFLQLGQSSGRSGPRAQVGAGLDRGIPSILPARTPHVAGRRAHTSRKAPRRNESQRKLGASGGLPVNYVRSGSTQSASISANTGGTPGGGGPPPSSTTPPSPHTNTPQPSPNDSTPGKSHRQSRSCTFGPNCALGPGHSPDG